MKSIKRKVARLADRTKINSERLVRIVKGKGQAGRAPSSKMEPVARRTLPQLPIEVWENVIDHLWDDRWTLRQCVHVCRAWYPLSRFHLDGPITIRSVKRVEAFAEMLKQMPEWSERVYDMTIEGDYMAGTDDQTDLSALSTAAIMLAPKLPRLETLAIVSSEWKPWTMHRDIFLHLPAFSVTRLHLRDVTFPSITVFGHLVCALPGLVELKCKSLDFTHDHFHHDVFRPYHNRANIRSLSLEGNYLTRPEKLIDFLAHRCFSSHLQRLIIDDVVQYQYMWQCQRLLDAASGSLSELQLHLYLGHSKVSASGSLLSFTHNISVQRIQLTVPGFSRTYFLDALCQVLLSIRSGQLREIVIIIQVLPYGLGLIRMKEKELKTMLEIDESAIYEQIDNYLSSDSFSMLSKVEFALKNNIAAVQEVTEEQLKQQLEPLFPRLTERGIFHATLTDRAYQFAC